MLFCEPNYEIVGSNFAHCNGSHWDRVIGTCRETDNTAPMSCDFESEFHPSGRMTLMTLQLARHSTFQVKAFVDGRTTQITILTLSDATATTTSQFR